MGKGDYQRMYRVFRFLGITALVIATGAIAMAQEPNSPATSRPAIHVAHESLRKLSWQMAVPTGVFDDLAVSEAIDLLHGLDVHHLELTPGQPLFQGLTGEAHGKFPPAEAVAKMTAKLKLLKMDIVSYGPVDLRTPDADARSIFAFAKAIKAKIVIVIPGAGDLEPLDALATEFNVGVAIPGGTEPFATPEALTAALAGRSRQVKGCIDTAAWTLAGIDLRAATKAIGSNTSDVRIQDDASGKPATSGPGALDYVGILTKLKTNGFKGIVTIRCAPGPRATQLDRLIASVNAFSDALKQVATTN